MAVQIAEQINAEIVISNKPIDYTRTRVNCLLHLRCEIFDCEYAESTLAPCIKKLELNC